MATISDVAKLSGISVSTVSRVINDSPHVSPEKRQKVLDAMEQLGYTPMQAARQMRGSGSQNIAVVIPSITNTFFAYLVNAIERTCREYEGEELGMTNADFTEISEYRDLEALDIYKDFTERKGMSSEYILDCLQRKSRDNARTPMQWTDGENAGFTTGKPWLKVNANYTKINAESQMNDPESVRSFYKKLIALRKDPEYKETVVYGELEPVWEDVHNLMAYYRKGDKNLLVVGNYQKEPQTIELAGECRKVLINNYDNVAMDGNKIELQGYQFLVIEM